MMMELLPGDCLLYFHPSEPLDWAIAFKTWTKTAHVEIYRGEGLSFASRNGIGVNLYAVRWDGLITVRRPLRKFGTFDPAKASQWFYTVQGQKYDWKGLLCFTLAVKQGSLDRMFCSEFATRLYRAAQYPVMADDYDADCVAPAQFKQTPVLETIWKESD